MVVNAGGRVFETTLRTLRAVPGSYFTGPLEAFLEGSERQIFLDLDPDAVALVLEYLRSKSYGYDLDLTHEPRNVLSRTVGVARYLLLDELAEIVSRPTAGFLQRNQ